MSDLTMTERIIFRGRVQGVGFRATTHAISSGRPVTGYVRNLADGTVELMASGTRTAIDAFVSSITQHFHDHLSGYDRQSVGPNETITDFRIRF